MFEAKAVEGSINYIHMNPVRREDIACPVSVRIQGSGSALTWAMTHNNANEITTVNYSSGLVDHDDAGNMTRVLKPGQQAVYAMVYDPWNRLTKAIEGGTTYEYEYDGQHRRIEKKVGGDTYDYYYNLDNQVVETYKNGVSSERYSWHPYYIDALATRYYADAPTGQKEQYAAHDANFNVTGLFTVNATPIERYHYTPYGSLQVLDANYNEITTGSTVANPYTYTGRRFDDETGLYYYRNRYYDSQLGRFISRDPTRYDGSPWNLYQYVLSSPVAALDPSGLQTTITDSPYFTGWDKFKDIIGSIVPHLSADNQLGQPNWEHRGTRISHKYTTTEENVYTETEVWFGDETRDCRCTTFDGEVLTYEVKCKNTIRMEFWIFLDRPPKAIPKGSGFYDLIALLPEFAGNLDTASDLWDSIKGSDAGILGSGTRVLSRETECTRTLISSERRVETICD